MQATLALQTKKATLFIIHTVYQWSAGVRITD
jgi:hypothetical protein